jgi:hypothetical protein
LDGLLPEARCSALEPAGVIDEIEAAEETEAEGEALEGDVELIEGEQETTALFGALRAQRCFGSVSPIGEALIRPAVGGGVHGDPEAIVGGEFGEVGGAEEGLEEGWVYASEDGGDGAEGFFAVEVIIEGHGVAVDHDSVWIVIDGGFVAHDFEGEIEVFIAIGPECCGEAGGAKIIAVTDGNIEIPGVAMVVEMMRLESIVEEDHGGFFFEGVEDGGI